MLLGLIENGIENFHFLSWLLFLLFIMTMILNEKIQIEIDFENNFINFIIKKITLINFNNLPKMSNSMHLCARARKIINIIWKYSIQ